MDLIKVKAFVKNLKLRQRHDGRVEGCELTTSYENTKSQLTTKQPPTKIAGTYQKWSLTSKDKEATDEMVKVKWSKVKLFSLVWLFATPQTVAYQASPSMGFSRQWDGRRSAIMIKSNPIPTRWAVHKLENNYTTEVLPQEWQYWAPCEAPLTGCLATGGRGPRKSGFEGQWSLITGIPQDWGKQKLHSWRAHTRSYVHQDPRNKAGTSKCCWSSSTLATWCKEPMHWNFPQQLPTVSEKDWGQ